MFNLDSIKAALKNAVSKVSGDKDFLEALCAASALVASSDGEVADSELKMLGDQLNAHPVISAKFKGAEINACVDKMIKRANQGRMSRVGLYKEIDDVKNNADKAEQVYLCALDVAHADGKVEASEEKVLREISKRLGVNGSAYDSL